MKSNILKLFLLMFINFTFSAPQLNPEINDQFEIETTTDTANYTTYPTTTSTKKPQIVEVINENNEIFDEELDTAPNKSTNNVVKEKQSVISRIYKIVKFPIAKLIETPKVHTVLRNIGTCVVNGVMEIVSYYLPAPFIPLIASAAGMVIPFEPVVMLRRRMPVTSYRRAIKTAVNSFMNTFDAYKFDNNYDEDPYMTRRFNRRFMSEASKDETTKTDVHENKINDIKSLEND